MQNSSDMTRRPPTPYVHLRHCHLTIGCQLHSIARKVKPAHIEIFAFLEFRNFSSDVARRPRRTPGDERSDNQRG